MPLKVLELREQLDAAKLAAVEHRNSRPDFASRHTALEQRRSDLDKRIDALPEDAPDTVRAEIDSAVTQIETDAAALKDAENAFDSAAFDSEQERLDSSVKELERQIAEIEERNEPVPVPQAQIKNTDKEVRTHMHRFISSAMQTRESREAFMNREDSKKFIAAVRAIGNEGRSVENVDKVIPGVWLDVLREEMPGASKLLKYCRYNKVRGNARQPMTTTVPEAIWFEATKYLNGASLGFADVEYDSYGVGCYIAIPNLYLASDSVVDLGTEIMESLIGALAVGMDKAILYGNNTKMPLGVVTRIAQTSDPSDPSINFPWVDIHSTNVITISADTTGAAFFKSLVGAKKVCKKKRHATPHGFVWLMNSTTHAAVDAEGVYANVLALGVNSDGTAYMPVIKGAIEELEFIPDNNIVCGYFDLYGVAEREGGEIGKSDLPLYLQNATVYKAVTYADGMPLEPAAFAVIGIGGTNPTTSLSFAPDYANMDMNTLTVTAAAHGSTSGKTVLTVSGKLANANTLKYKIGLEGPAIGTALDNTWTSLTSGSTAITAAAGTWITVAELDANSNVVGIGYVQSIPKA